MKTVIEMAREVYGEHTLWAGPQLERLEQFAEIVASLARADAIAKEREACAQLCAEDASGGDSGGYYAEIIRDRSNT